MNGYGKNKPWNPWSGSWVGGGGSVSGWEKSLFGGYHRVLTDYPYIKLNFELEVNPERGISKDLGTWMGEKLIKLYILKAKELNLIDHFRTKIVEEMKFLKVKKYMVANLDHVGIFNEICINYTELAPMFEHYKDGIFASEIRMEITGENKSNGEGESGERESGERESREGESGEGESGEGENQEGEDQGDEDGEGNEGPKKMGNGRNPNNTKNGKTIQEYMNDISESKPYTHTTSLSNFSHVPKFVSFAHRIKEDNPKPNRFTSEEIKNAEALIKLLDISFDPTSAEVKNLKLGKLDVSKIAEVPAGNLSVYKQNVEEQDTKPFSVCILADMSGSMGSGNRIFSQLKIMNSLYLAMRQILPPDKLYIYGHSGDNHPEIYSFYTPHDPDYEHNITYYRNGVVDWCQNYDGPVIESIHRKIRESSEDRIIFISLSDGEPCGNGYGGKQDNEELKKILERARRDSFVTVGIGIEAGHVSNLYTYAKPVWNLAQLPKDVSGIINQVVRSEFK
ncbi:hypothetical protein EBR43_02810 [bacterium]|nr:hypothetical protein [bacterium]